MADSILRLKVDSQEYDQKIKRAAEGIQRYAEQCRKAGGTLEHLDDGVEEFVRALGQMETVSKSAKGSINEMTKAFTELSVQYNKLTDEEKNATFGQALKVSLDELKGRIQAGNAEIKNINDSLNGSGGLAGALDQVAGKLGMNVKQLASWGAAIGAAKTALDVAKDALFSNEETLDDWGRTVESAEGLYTGFLDALNTGDISGYLQRIDQIVKAAQDAYNAIDALNTFNAFNQINVEKTRTGMTEAIADYRGGKGSKESVKAAGEAYKKELSERKNLERQAYIEAVGKVAAERGVSKQDLLTALSGTYGSYQSLKAIPMSGRQTRYTPGGMFGGSTAYEVEVPANRQEKLGAALRRLNDTELQSLQALGAQAERTGNEIASVDKQLTRVLNGIQGGGGGNTKTTKSLNIAFDPNRAMLAAERGFDTMPSVWAMIGDQGLRDMLGIGKQQFDYGGKVLDNYVNDPDADKRKKKGEESTEKLAKAMSGLSSIMSGIEGIGIEIPGEIKDVINVIQSAMAIIQGVQTVISVFSTSTETANTAAVIANTVALGALTTAMAANTATNLVPGLAGGGIAHAANGFIGGNTFSGDQIPIMVNAGELILNRAQQGNLASQLQGGGMGNLQLEAVVRGEDLRFIINSNGRRTGRGEIVTTNFR